MIRIGAHLSIQGGLDTAYSKAQEIGVNALQIFSSPPQRWESSRITVQAGEQWKQKFQLGDISPIFVHGAYLINLASDNPESVVKSTDSLTADLIFCDRIGALGVIFHFGSHLDGWHSKKSELVPVIHRILENTPPNTLFIIENAAGSGSKVGSTFDELGTMLRDIADSRVMVCLDTAHALAAGYEFRTLETARMFHDEVEEKIGWKNIVAIHLNDSKVDKGKKSDRHENIGDGCIGRAGFTSLLSQIENYEIPLILETPGLDNNGPDKENVDRVKSLLTTSI